MYAHIYIYTSIHLTCNKVIR